MISVACVWVGQKYGFEYVTKLQSMVKRHLPVPHRFVCFTDNQAEHDEIEFVRVFGHGLRGWWAKMALFSTKLRGPGRCIYFDLDTVILGDLTPLAEYDGDFAICENFTRLAGHENWPCRYGSCCMVFPDGFGDNIYQAFMRNPFDHIMDNPKGDQQAIEKLYPNAVYLQDVMPAGFFWGRREFSDNVPRGTSVAIFAGNTKPHNTGFQWIQEEWR